MYKKLMCDKYVWTRYIALYDAWYNVVSKYVALYDAWYYVVSKYVALYDAWYIRRL